MTEYVYVFGGDEEKDELIQRREDDNFKGVCNYHSNCLEGLASGPAIEKRWGKKANELYQLMNDNLIEISLKRTKYTQKLVNLEKK